MYSLLLRKALPFALTFILGSLVGGLFKAVGVGGGDSARAYFYRHGGRHACGARSRQRYLVAESKPLAITFKPDAYVLGVESAKGDARPAVVNVTFGADGKVGDVSPVGSEYGPYSPQGRLAFAWEAVERAARSIRFEPETVNGVPVTVTREVRIHVTTD